MGEIIKHGDGNVMPAEDDIQKQADGDGQMKSWSPEDEEQLVDEIAQDEKSE